MPTREGAGHVPSWEKVGARLFSRAILCDALVLHHPLATPFAVGGCSRYRVRAAASLPARAEFILVCLFLVLRAHLKGPILTRTFIFSNSIFFFFS